MCFQQHEFIDWHVETNWFVQLNCIYIWWFVNSCPIVLHICVDKLGKHCFRLWLVACSAPGHYYLNQCWLVVNWTPRNKFQWNTNRNTKFMKMYLEMSSAKWLPFCQGKYMLIWKLKLPRITCLPDNNSSTSVSSLNWTTKSNENVPFGIWYTAVTSRVFVPWWRNTL